MTPGRFPPRTDARPRSRVLRTLAAAALAVLPFASGASYLEPPEVTAAELHDFWRLDVGSWFDAIDRAEVLRLGLGCAAVAFDIEPDGTTSHVRVVRSRPSGRHHEAVVRIASALRFTAAVPADPRRVRTRYVISFGAGRERTLGTRISAGVRVDDRANRACALRD